MLQIDSLNPLNLSKTTPQNSFLKFYVMGSTEINLYGIAHVKVDIIPPPKRYVMPRLGRFDWTSCFAQCEILPNIAGLSVALFLKIRKCIFRPIYFYSHLFAYTQYTNWVQTFRQALGIFRKRDPQKSFFHKFLFLFFQYQFSNITVTQWVEVRYRVQWEVTSVVMDLYKERFILKVQIQWIMKLSPILLWL